MKKHFLVAILLFVFSATNAQNERDSLIVSSFWQGKANNCASIALIKAAMLKYGYKSMFIVNTTQSEYNVTLKDQTSFSITKNELKKAITFGNFSVTESDSLREEKDSILFYAHLAYASIAKFISIKGYWGCEEDGEKHYFNHNTYSKALKFISKTSFCTDYSYRLLGYKSKDQKIFNFTNSSEPLCLGSILFSNNHAVATYKNFLDCHGNWIPISLHETCDNTFK